MPAAPAVTSGELVAGQFRVERLLGEGGMGAVFAVRDERTGGSHALKLLIDCDDPERVKRFFREARATMRLSSDHVVRVLDVGSVDGRTPFMVMERLEGATLKELIRRGRVDERLASDLVLQACEGLAHAHAHGIVHRDVKPSNLFVVAGRHLKVLDFGISKVASFHDWEKTASVTNSDALLGSPHFISPEQLRNAARVDERADIWSLGVVLYHTLTRRFPFDGPSLAELLVAIMHRKLTPMGDFVPVSPAMEAIVVRCLERDPAVRFQDVGELAVALAPLASPDCAALAERIRRIVGDSRQRHVVHDDEAQGDGTVSLAEGPPADTLADRVEQRWSHPGELHGPMPPTPAEALAIGATTPPPRPPSRRIAATLGIVAGVVLVVATAGALVVLRRANRRAPAATTLATPATGDTAPAAAAAPVSGAPPEAAPSKESTPASSDRELELVADGPIAKVTVANAQRVSLERGRAYVDVPPWRGDLPIEAELASGALARGTARDGGPLKIRLTTVKRGSGARSRPGDASSGAPRASKPGTGTKAGGEKAGELHDDPYGK